MTDPARQPHAAGSRCALAGCGFPSALHVARLIPAGGLAHSQFVAAATGSPANPGVPLCLEHAHSALDSFLLGARPVPTP